MASEGLQLHICPLCITTHTTQLITTYSLVHPNFRIKFSGPCGRLVLKEVCLRIVPGLMFTVMLLNGRETLQIFSSSPALTVGLSVAQSEVCGLAQSWGVSVYSLVVLLAVFKPASEC